VTLTVQKEFSLLAFACPTLVSVILFIHFYISSASLVDGCEKASLPNYTGLYSEKRKTKWK